MRNGFELTVSKVIGADYAYEAIRLPYTIEHHYTPDWVNVEAKEIIEAKGYFPAEDRKKMKAIRRQYPDWTITIIFQNPHMRISKSSKTTYAQWCVKNGIAWSGL